MTLKSTATVKVEVQKFRTRKQEELLKMLEDKQVRKHINTLVKDAINPFVPMKSGALRRSAIVTHLSITWGRGLKYGGYQYRGEVYGPNFPIAINGSPAWRSPRGEGSKHPTGRKIGAYNGTVQLYPKYQIGNRVDGPLTYKLGYTTPGTKHHWDSKFSHDVKLRTNQNITRYLKSECKRRGLT